MQNSLRFCLTEEHNIALETERPGLCLGEDMAPSQVHDTHYWLDYNEGQGNNSLWCLCIDDFKPRTTSTSHTLTVSQ